MFIYGLQSAFVCFEALFFMGQPQYIVWIFARTYILAGIFTGLLEVHTVTIENNRAHLKRWEP